MRLCSISIKTTSKKLDGQLLQLTILLENSEKTKMVEDLPLFNCYIYYNKIEGDIEELYKNSSVLEKLNGYIKASNRDNNKEFNELFDITMEQIKNGKNISQATKEYWYNLDILIDKDNFYQIFTKFLLIHGFKKNSYGTIDINFVSIENSHYILNYLYKTFPDIDKFFNINKIFFYPQTFLQSSKDSKFKKIDYIFDELEYIKPKDSKEEVKYNIRLLRSSTFYQR